MNCDSMISVGILCGECGECVGVNGCALDESLDSNGVSTGEPGVAVGRCVSISTVITGVLNMSVEGFCGNAKISTGVTGV